MKSTLGPDRVYPGLRPYGFEDAGWFFGREDQSLALYRLIDRGRLVAVVGGSGSGKSSVVRAGLLPLIEEETAGDGGRHWTWWSMRPGEAPVARLAETLAGPTGDKEDAKSLSLWSAERERIEFMLRKSSFGLVDVLRGLPDSRARTPLLLVDQFEELFRFSDLPGSRAARAGRREEAAAFVQLLLEAARSPDLAVRVILTMRSDYLGDCARFQGLPEAVTESEFLVPSLNRDQREEAIRGPAERADGSVSDDLLQSLLNDSNEELDQLPVMQHALMRTWAHAMQRGSRKLTLDDYVAIGAMAGSISQHADELLDEPAMKGRELAVEQVFRALAELDRQGRGTRRPLQLHQLVDECGVGRADVVAVVDRFRSEDCSFLVPAGIAGTPLGEEDVVDVGHEALIRRWSRISRQVEGTRSGWLIDEAVDGRTYVALLATAEGGQPGQATALPIDQIALRSAWWELRPRSPAWTERYGGQIDKVRKLLADSVVALRESERDKARSRRNSLVAYGGLLVIAITFPLLVLLWYQFNIAQEQTRLAQDQMKFALVESITAKQEQKNAELAMKRAESAEGDLRKMATEAGFAAIRATVQASVATQKSNEATKQRSIAESARSEAEDERARAQTSSQIAWSSLLVSRAITEASTNIDRSLLLSLAAMRIAPSPQARDGLLRGLQRAQHIEAVLGRHQGTVRGVAISPDGRILASAGDDDRVMFWDLPRRRLLSGAPGISLLGVRRVAFSPDGNLFATGDSFGVVTLWNVATQLAELDRPPDHDGAITDLAFSPDGKTLASASLDGTVRRWDVVGKVPLGEPIATPVHPVAALRGSSSPSPAALQKEQANFSTRGFDRELADANGARIAFSPDSSQLACVGDNLDITLRDVATGRITAPPLQFKNMAVTSLAFSPDGKLLAAGTKDKRVLLWDVGTRELSKQLPIVHTAEVTDVAFSHDGKTLASASIDKRLILWDVATRLPSGEPLTVNQAWPLSLAFTSDDSLLASGNSDDSVVLWDLTGRRALSTELKGHTESVMTVAFSPGGHTLASGGADKKIVLWDPVTHGVKGTLEGHKQLVISLAFSPDGKRLASASFDGQFRLWDLATLQTAQVLEDGEGKPEAVAFSPDGRLLLAGRSLGYLALWDVTRSPPTAWPLPSPSDDLRSVAFSPQGTVFASAGLDKRIVLWDAARREALSNGELPNADKLVSIAFSPDGKTIASAGYDKQVVLWDVASRKRIGEPLQGHQDQVWAVAFSPDGKLLASGGRDNRVMLWDLESRTPMGEPLTKHTNAVRGLAFSPDGRHLASGGYDSRVVLWNVSVGEWQRRACEIANRPLTKKEWEEVVGTALPYTPVCPEDHGAPGSPAR